LLLSNDIDSFTAYYDIEVAHEIRMLLIGWELNQEALVTPLFSG
jgi:hypothetical protein